MKTGQQKMSKSAGNEIVVREVLKRHDPETVRFLLLSTHYRSPIEYSEDRLAEVQRSLEGFYRFFERYERITETSFYTLTPPAERGSFDRGPEPSINESNPDAFFIYFEVAPRRDKFLSCMDDDFNTGGAVGTLFELLTVLNAFADKNGLDWAEPDAAALDKFQRGTLVLRELSHILGLFWEPPQRKKLGGDDVLVAGLMQLLIDVRNNLRAEAKKIAAKDDPVKKAMFGQTDLIRQRLGELGVTLEDRPGDTGWRVG
jgi:cysteinyl-tRNA synthetase